MILYLILLLCCIAIFAAGWYLGTASLMLYLGKRGVTISKIKNGVVIMMKIKGSTYCVCEKRGESNE